MSTLRLRLTVGLSLILIVVFLGLWATFHYAIQTVAERQVLIHLKHDGDSIYSAFHFSSVGEPVLNEAVIEEIYLQPYSGHYYLLYIDNKLAITSRSLGNHRLSSESMSPGETSSKVVEGPNSQYVLIFSQGHTLQGHRVSITVGEDLTEMNLEISRISLASLGLILSLLIITVFSQRLIIRRELQPLSGVQGELQMIRQGELEYIQGQVPGEIRPLVDEVNRLLELMHRRLQQSRTAVGNLAHALKTPLAVLFRIADDPSLCAEHRAVLQTQTAVIRDRIERELTRARLAGSDRIGSQVNIQTELQLMSKVLASIYRDKCLDITTEAPNHSIPYDREDLLELLGNLTDNACKWAKRRVCIQVRELPDGGINLVVSDDGPGCNTEMSKHLGRRGTRLDESKHGHGLGLAICQDIVDYYGGHLEIGCDKYLGGMIVNIELPGWSNRATSGQDMKMASF